jgi:hypothetical protein
VIDAHAALVFGGSDGDHERYQMVFSRMALAGAGGVVPLEEQFAAPRLAR